MRGRHLYNKASSKIGRRVRWRKNLKLFFKILIPLSFLSLLLLTFGAGFLQIQNIELTGNQSLQSEDIEKRVFHFLSGTKLFLIPRSNIVFFNKSELASLLLSTFPRLEKLEIEKKLNRNIELKIKEREPKFLWCSSDLSCFLMSQDGLIFAKAEEGDRLGKFIFKGLIGGEDPILKQYASPEKIQDYLRMVEEFERANFHVLSLNIDTPPKAILETDVGDIIFSPEEKNLSLVAENVLLLIQEIKTKNPSARFEYLDARFGNKIFYKLI